LSFLRGKETGGAGLEGRGSINNLDPQKSKFSIVEREDDPTQLLTVGKRLIVAGQPYRHVISDRHAPLHPVLGWPELQAATPQLYPEGWPVRVSVAPFAFRPTELASKSLA
jgi:hypothetical protein